MSGWPGMSGSLLRVGKFEPKVDDFIFPAVRIKIQEPQRRKGLIQSNKPHLTKQDGKQIELLLAMR
jgi:hypothetical protein